MNDPDSKWTMLAGALREAGVNAPEAAGDLTAPPGFTTRVVAHARPDRGRSVAWKRLSLCGAGAAVAALAIAVLALPPVDRHEQFLPVPALEFPADEIQ